MTCARCGARLPAGSRRDRLYCTKNCRALASYERRKAGVAPLPRWQHPALASTNPALHAAALRAHELGQTHGWSPSTLTCALDGLSVLLTDRPDGEPVTLTAVRTRMPRHTSRPRVAEVLADVGLLHDDTVPAVRDWIERRTAELPAAFAGDVRAWLLVLLDGDARARPRSHSCTGAWSPCPFICHPTSFVSLRCQSLVFRCARASPTWCASVMVRPPTRRLRSGRATGTNHYPPHATARESRCGLLRSTDRHVLRARRLGRRWPIARAVAVAADESRSASKARYQVHRSSGATMAGSIPA